MNFLTFEKCQNVTIDTFGIEFWLHCVRSASDKMAPFNHTHMQRWVALQPVNHLLDMCVCQNLLISCLIYHKILQAVWASNLSGSIREDPAILGVMIGIIWRCSPLLPILTREAHILQEIAHSATACHGVLSDLISHCYHQFSLIKKKKTI